jgi:hypothetical protein
VVSYPKSGRTWHRLLVGNYLAQVTGMDPKRSHDLDFLCDRAALPAIKYSHNGANFLDMIPPRSAVVASADLWCGRNVLLIVRNPKDILVSAYFHARYRTQSFDGSLSDFIRNPATGIAKLLTAFNCWDETRGRASSFSVISYEAMHNDPMGILATSLVVLGVNELNPAIIKAAVEFSGLENMREYEAVGYFRGARLRRAPGDENAAKVREGRVGGFAGHLSADDIDFIDRKVARLGNPFAALCGAPSSLPDGA